MIPENEKRLLKLIGITFNQIESGVYAVLLEEAEGTRRIPIIIGYPEAQAIECKLQEIVTPRPLTHDFIVSMIDSFGAKLQEVQIHKLPEGVFAAEVILNLDGKTHIIDSRSSDAIALAIRVDAPIYTSRDVIDEVGFEATQNNAPLPRRAASASKASPLTKVTKTPYPSDLTSISTRDLKIHMKEAAEKEDYELAASIKAEIQRRGDDPNDLTDIVAG